MEVAEPLRSAASVNLDTAAGAKRSNRYAPQRSPSSPKRTAGKDVKSRQMPTRSPTSGRKDLSLDKPLPRPRLASVSGKPLVPRTIRKSQDEKPIIARRKDSEPERWEIAPDGGSAGREGRQFTVSNVGNNGKIYLRPSVRPPYMRTPQPAFTFPITPPDTAGLEESPLEKSSNKDETSKESPLWVSEPGTSPLSTHYSFLPGYQTLIPPRRPQHRRALSDSTIQEASVLNETDTGAFKIVISRPGDGSQPHATRDLDSSAAPVLDVDIPSWKIGRPQLTARGQMVMRGSSYAPTEELSAVAISRKASSQALPYLDLSRTKHPVHSQLASPNLLQPLRSTFFSARQVIHAGMFDALTFKPACDDITIVRYSRVTGAVTAGTPPRIVAEITSPTFLDYELISDFFLTFRIYLDPSDLLKMLFARLRWAIERNDEIGMIVRVRSFVALRHWILNYFMEDFVVDHALRQEFCDLLNGSFEELTRVNRVRKLQLGVLEELKKCWRRVCSQYWDDPEPEDNLGLHVPVTSGGVAGHRNPKLDPSFWDSEHSISPATPHLLLPHQLVSSNGNLRDDVSRAGHLTDPAVGDITPGSPEVLGVTSPDPDSGVETPMSVASTNVVSCSFPNKITRAAPANRPQPLGAHPVTSTTPSNYSPHGPVATTPKSLGGKQVRQKVSQDSTGDVERVTHKEQEVILAKPGLGSLVRGNVLPPTQPFVDTVLSTPGAAGERQTTLFEAQRQELPAEKLSATAMSGHGMRKLLVSVRKALTARPSEISEIPRRLPITSGTQRPATINRVPGTAVVPQEQPKTNNQQQHAVRIDLLAAEVSEGFNAAVHGAAAMEAAQQTQLTPPLYSARPAHTTDHYSPAHLESSDVEASLGGTFLRPTSDTELTTGSQSIVIGHDTVPFNMGNVLGQPVDLPLDRIQDSPPLSEDRHTPPHTPPCYDDDGLSYQPSEFARQSSLHPRPSFELRSPFIMSMASRHRRTNYSSIYTHQRQDSSRSAASRPHPPLSRSSRMHRRNKSARTQISLNSIIEHHVPSLRSESIFWQPSTQSFDASSYSDESIYRDSHVPMPPPLRVLRRRPGGNLKAAQNIDDLGRRTLRRSRSIGSLTSYSESIHNHAMASGYGMFAFDQRHPPRSLNSQNRSDAFSVGQLANKPTQNVSLVSLRSSRAANGAPFDFDTDGLADIPDRHDDGGVESALLKLEGRFDKTLSPSANDFDVFGKDGIPDPEDIGLALGSPSQEQDYLHVHVGNETAVPELDSPDVLAAASTTTGSSPKASLASQREMHSFLSTASQDSYSSTPLLDRDLTGDGLTRRGTREWTDKSVFFAESDDEDATTPRRQSTKAQQRHEHKKSDASFNFINKPDSMIAAGEDRDLQSRSGQSFLDVDSDEEDLSTELRTVERKQAEESDDETTHKLPAAQPRPFDTKMINMPEMHEDPNRYPNPETHRPRVSPTAAEHSQQHISEGTGGPNEALHGATVHVAESPSSLSVHLPFILAFDSEVLAQQFTLIEKDALNEVDWKELIDMKWKNAPIIESQSWVDFLQNSDARGVEVVIARFNIVVKWAVSEIMLTQNLEERARCIIKLIHVAEHCRKYRNFATLAQITIALSSNEVARLARTWELVPANDHKTLKALEALVTPTRNFYNLRADMESGSSGGCIPFVGIYTHDLLVNAQRPAEIASSPSTPPLINFERCRRSAAVVKTLLRLLEASTRYDFKPIEGIIERCLWLGALSNSEIRQHANLLER